jgi:hypothetical protein
MKKEKEGKKEGKRWWVELLVFNINEKSMCSKYYTPLLTKTFLI